MSFLMISQFRGHEAATLDPLGLHTFRPATPPPELDPKFHGFTDADLDRPMNLAGRRYVCHGGEVVLFFWCVQVFYVDGFRSFHIDSFSDLVLFAI